MIGLSNNIEDSCATYKPKASDKLFSTDKYCSLTVSTVASYAITFYNAILPIIVLLECNLSFFNLLCVYP